jgi:hypothetical protein
MISRHFLIFFIAFYCGVNRDVNSNDQFMTHCWPIWSSTMLDEIGDAHMTQGALTTFSTDRFGNANAALNLNGGWTQVPSGFYFNTPAFTISTWIYPQSIGLWARLIDFGNGANSNNVVFAIGSPTNIPAFQICITSPCTLTLSSSQALALNEWQFLAVTYDGSNANIYINSLLTANLTYNLTMPHLNTTSNLIGKSNIGGNHGYSLSHIDDLRFYNKSLTQNDLLNVMKLNSSKNIVFEIY